MAAMIPLVENKVEAFQLTATEESGMTKDYN